MPSILPSTLLALALGGALTATAQPTERREIPAFATFGTPALAPDAAAIDDLLKTYAAAWQAHDTAAVVALHAPDVEWINAYARLLRGTAALQDFLQHRLFPALPPAVAAGEAAHMKPISLRYIGADAAVAHLYTDGQRGPSRNAGEASRRTHIHLVLARQAEGWRIVHCAIADAR